jgi:hypothetical protein
MNIVSAVWLMVQAGLFRSGQSAEAVPWVLLKQAKQALGCSFLTTRTGMCMQSNTLACRSARLTLLLAPVWQHRLY